MKTTIYYFSGTGNSLAVAKELADKLGNCQLIPIAQVWQQDRIVADAERIGLVFPLYYVGLPKLVLEFVQKADFSTAQYLFAVITRGAAYMGGAIHHLKQLLSMKAPTLQAGWYVDMPENYIAWFNLPSEAKQQVMFQKASQKVLAIADQIQRGANASERFNRKIEQCFAVRYGVSSEERANVVLRSVWLKELLLNGQHHLAAPSPLNALDLSKICQEHVDPGKILHFFHEYAPSHIEKLA